MNNIDDYPYPYFTNRSQKGSKERVVVMVGKDLLHSVDEIGLSQGFNSRSAILRHLIETGLKEFKQQKAVQNPKG